MNEILITGLCVIFYAFMVGVVTSALDHFRNKDGLNHPENVYLGLIWPFALIALPLLLIIELAYRLSNYFLDKK